MHRFFYLAAASLALWTAQAADNVLTPKEKSDGWELLFDGNSTTGWHNFKSTGVKIGRAHV